VKNIIVKIVLGLVILVCVKYLIANSIVPFYSDIRIEALIELSIPVLEAIWIHRTSIFYLLALIASILSIIFRWKYANYFIFVILASILIDVNFNADFQTNDEDIIKFERIEYNDPDYGAKVEKIARIGINLIEILLVSSLLLSKNIRDYFNK